MATSTKQTVATVAVYDYILAAGDPTNTNPKGMSGKKVKVTLAYDRQRSSAPATWLLETPTYSAVTDQNGFWQVNVVPTDQMAIANTYYIVEIDGYASYKINPVAAGVPGIGWQSSAILLDIPATLGPAGQVVTGNVTINGTITLQQQTVSPSAPVGGYDVIYAKTDGRIYRQTSSTGMEIPFDLAVYNILDYGASTAIADNGPAVNTAIAAWLAGGKRGVVFVPPGVFPYTTPITNTHDGLVLWGAGLSASVLRFTGAGAGTAVDSHNTNYTELRQIGFEYNNGAYTGALVDIGRGSSPKAVACYFGATFAANVRSSLCGLSVQGSVTPVVDGCVFDGNTDDILMDADVSVSPQTAAFLVVGCDFNNNAMSARSHIRNPVSGRIVACNFENLANGTVKIISMASTAAPMTNVSVEACWNADIWNLISPTATAAAGATGLAGGTYTLAFSYVVNGIESLLSPPVQVTLLAGQQINVGTVPFASVAVGDQVINPTAVRWYYTAVPGGMTAGFIVQNANGNAFSITNQGNGVANAVGTFGTFEVFGQNFRVSGSIMHGSSSSGNSTSLVKVVAGKTLTGLAIRDNSGMQYQQLYDISAGADKVFVENNDFALTGDGVGTPTSIGSIQNQAGLTIIYGGVSVATGNVTVAGSVTTTGAGGTATFSQAVTVQAGGVNVTGGSQISQLAVGTATSQLGTAKALYVSGSLTAQSGAAWSVLNGYGTLNAAANNDVLIGLSFEGWTFAVGALTGTSAYGIRSTGSSWSKTGTAAIATAYALYADGPTIATTNYALYVANGGTFIGGNVGFYGTQPQAKQTVTGSKGANAALTSLMTALATLGLVTDSTT